MPHSLKLWPLYANFTLLALNPAPAYPDVATQMQELFDRHEMSTDRAPEVEAMMDEMEERWGPVHEQVEQALHNLNTFRASPEAQRLLMQDDIPYTRELYTELLAAFRLEDAYYQWEMTQLEHYFERYDASECLVKLSQARNYWNSHCKTSLMRYARSDVSTLEGRIDALEWESAYMTDKLQFTLLGGNYAALKMNFSLGSLNCTAVTPNNLNTGGN